MKEKNSIKIESFGDRLSVILKREGFSQKDLAKLLGVHINTVSQWVRGMREPNLTILRFISHYLNIEYTWLITGETPVQYAARRQTRKLVLADEKAVYGEPTEKEIENLVAKIVNLDNSSRNLVKELVDKLGGER